MVYTVIHSHVVFTLQIIVVGDEDGSVNVYQLKKMNATPDDQVRRTEPLPRHILKTQHKFILERFKIRYSKYKTSY